MGVGASSIPAPWSVGADHAQTMHRPFADGKQKRQEEGEERSGRDSTLDQLYPREGTLAYLGCNQRRMGEILRVLC